jgi:hypothetical protein
MRRGSDEELEGGVWAPVAEGVWLCIWRTYCLDHILGLCLKLMFAG